MSIFALSVVPYISAAIVMQLFSNSLPYLQELKKDGQAGRNKITQYTRYGTVIFALIQLQILHTRKIFFLDHVLTKKVFVEHKLK